MDEHTAVADLVKKLRSRVDLVVVSKLKMLLSQTSLTASIWMCKHADRDEGVLSQPGEGEGILSGL